jgi:hypothetical protein
MIRTQGASLRSRSGATVAILRGPASPPRRPGISLFGRFIVVVMILAFASFGVASDEPRPCRNEPAITTAEYGDVLQCAIDLTTDTDLFRFSGMGGDRVRLRISRVGSYSNFEPCFELFDSRDRSVAIGCEYAANNEIDAVLATDDTYTVVVEDVYTNGFGQYNLTLERIGPPSPITADIQYGATMASQVDGVTDMDSFLFHGSRNDVIRLDIARHGNYSNFEPCFELFDADGESVAASCNYAASNRIDAVLPKSGAYTVFVEDVYTNGYGQYHLALQCLSGICSTKEEEIVAIVEEPSCEGASGISSIRGIAYSTQPGASIERLIRVKFDESTAEEISIDVPCCSSRGDAPVLLSGFSGAFNWCLLQPGKHSITLEFASSTGKTLTVKKDFISFCEHPDDPFLRDGEYDWAGSGTDKCRSAAGGIVACQTDPGVCNQEVRYEWTQARQGLALRSNCVPDGLHPPEAPACSDAADQRTGSIFD